MARRHPGQCCNRDSGQAPPPLNRDQHEPQLCSEVKQRGLKGIAVTAAGLEILTRGTDSSAQNIASPARNPGGKPTTAASLDGYTLVSEFIVGGTSWMVHEDLRTREGLLAFVSSKGEMRLLTKSAEASVPEGIPYLGLALKDIGVSSPDLLADRLLRDGRALDQGLPHRGIRNVPQPRKY